MTRIPTLPYTTLLAVLLTGLLSACANTGGTPSPDLGTLQLRETLNIEPDAATARLQYGRIVARNAVQEQDPFCVFELDTVRPETQIVQPRQFRIVAIWQSIETIASMPAFPFSWQTRRVVSSMDSGGPSHIYYKTHFRLQDVQQPATPPVRALTCMSNQAAPGNAAIMRHLTLPEIRAALGSWFSLSLEMQRF